MAETAFGTNDPRTQKKWSKAMYDYALGEMFFVKRGFMGTSTDSIVQVVKDLEKSAKGDKVVVELEGPLQGNGIGDGGTLIGNSEAMVNLSMEVSVHERAHSTQSAGPLDEKRTATNFRESAKKRIGRWLAQKQEIDIARALFGMGNEVATGTNPGTIRTVNPKYTLVGDDFEPLRHLIGGQNASGETDLDNDVHTALLAASTASQLFGVAVIRAARELAERTTDSSGNLIPAIRKINIDGVYCYVMLVHPWQAAQLRIDTEWKEAQKYAALRGSKNPIFTSSLGMIEDVVVHSYQYAFYKNGSASADADKRWVPATIDTDNESRLPSGVLCGRAVLMGAQAGTIAWGMLPTWRESNEDAGRKPVIGSDMILGVSKTVFRSYSTSDGYDADVDGTLTDQIPFATVTIDTQIQDPRTMEAAA